MRCGKIQCHQMTMVLELNMHSDMAYMHTDLHTTCLQNEILVASPENKLPSKKIIGANCTRISACTSTDFCLQFAYQGCQVRYLLTQCILESWLLDVPN